MKFWCSIACATSIFKVNANVWLRFRCAAQVFMLKREALSIFHVETKCVTQISMCSPSVEVNKRKCSSSFNIQTHVSLIFRCATQVSMLKRDVHLKLPCENAGGIQISRCTWSFHVRTHVCLIFWCDIMCSCDNVICVSSSHVQNN